MGALLVVIIAGSLYYVWSGSGSAEPLLTDSQGTSPLSQELLLTLGQVTTITLDETLFKDPVYLSLSDFGVTIPRQTAGRRNPFAPVGTTGAVATTTPR